jgi:heme/copper-type cytochrome/quinol oxidase subunit 2
VNTANLIATIVVFVALVGAVVVISVRRTRRRRIRKRPWISKSELLASVAVVVLLIAILSHTR